MPSTRKRPVVEVLTPVTGETTTDPALYVCRAKFDELKVSPETIWIGAWDFKNEAVGLVKTIS